MAEETQTNPSAVLQSGPWARIIQRYVTHYGNIRCERWSGPLVHLVKGMPEPVDYGEPVLKGIARKTAVTLRNVCSKCGAKGSPKRKLYGWEVLCTGCHGKALLAREIQQVLYMVQRRPPNPFDGKQAIWVEHKMTALLRQAMPKDCWRTIRMEDGSELKYMTRDDMREMYPWLKQLQLAMLGMLKTRGESAGKV